MKYMWMTLTGLSLLTLSCVFEVKGIPEQIELTGCPPFTQAATVEEPADAGGAAPESTDTDLTEAKKDAGCSCQPGDPLCGCI